MSMFFMEVFEHVNKSRVAEYEALSRETDTKVHANEPGMLVHVQTRVAEDERKVTYRWQETFQSIEDYRAHVQNPDVALHMQKLNDGILCAPIEVVVYCDWPDERKAKWLARTENLRFAGIVSGYLR